MKLTSSLLLSAALFGFMACSDAEKNDAQKAAATSTTQAGAPVALNPAHGEPGHRCDLQVGAPLNSAPAPNLTMPNLQPLPTTGSSTVAGTNPPHGEPGHDCAVPVGAPLNK